MAVLPLLLFSLCVAPAQKQSDFVSGADTLGKERQQFYRAISSQISPSIKARVNLRADDTLGIDWRKNDDGSTGETYIFPAGHSDRLYVTEVNPGWNAEQSAVYHSVTCFSHVKGIYAAVWTIDWRDSQGALPFTGSTGLAKLIGLDAQRVENKFLHDELVRVRPYALYRKGDADSPWHSEFFDDQGKSTASRDDDGKTASYTFNTLANESAYLSHSS